MPDEHLERFQQELRRVFRKRSATLPTYQPSSGPSSWKVFVASLKVPKYASQPMLMLQTFRGAEDSMLVRMQLHEIFRRGQHTLLQDVSGSGKTSLVIEGLRHHWGMYFVGGIDSWCMGSNDITKTLQALSNTSLERLMCEEIRTSMLKIPLLVRLLAFEIFAETVDIPNATEKDRELWLLVQACSQRYFRPTDEYAMLTYWMHDREPNHIDIDIEDAITRIRALTKDPDFHFFAVVDEAQVLAPRMGSCSSDGPQISPHRELARSWEAYSWLTVVVSGIAMPLELYSLDDSSSSPVYRITSATGSSDRSRVAQYIRKYLPPEIAATNSGQRLVARTSAWLHGRHRFSAAYASFYLEHGPYAPHTLLDDFIKRMTGFTPLDGEQFVREEATPMNHAKTSYLPLGTVNKHTPPIVRSTLNHVLYQFLVTGECRKRFGRDRIALIENAAGRFCDNTASQIVVDEPLCLVSAAQWFCSSEYAKSAGFFFDHKLVYNTDDPAMSSAREHIVLLLAHALSEARPFTDLFSVQTSSRSWHRLNVKLVEVYRSVDGGNSVFYPFSYAQLPSSRPVILATNCASHSDVLAWLRHEHTSPFCLLPDRKSLLFALRFSDGTFCWVVAQTSSETSDDLARCFYPPSSRQEDTSEIMTLLSQIPAPCDFLGLPPILRVTIASSAASPPADEPTLNMTYLESIASGIEQRDVLLRIVSNVIRVTEPHMPDASELQDPTRPPSMKPQRKSAAGSVRTSTSDKVSRPPEQTRYDLRPRHKAIPASTNSAVPITHDTVPMTVRRELKRTSTDGEGPPKLPKRKRTIT
ncbi:hypothetical protein GGF50DRAFT_55623 [Schizophyllum commune]